LKISKIYIFKIIAALVFIVVFNLKISAQVIQVGSGSLVTSVSTSSPVNIWYRRFVSQFVYTAAELIAAGASNTTPITQLGFYVENSPVYNIPGYTIKFKLTAATNVNAALGTTGWTTVKNSFTYNPNSGGFDMLVLDAPYLWDGVSNIGVEICCSQVTPNYDQSGTCRYYVTTNGYRYSWTDAVGNSCGSAPATLTVFKPQIQLVFAEETTWTGALSSDWFDNGNWTAEVPNQYMDAIIPFGVSNFPIIAGAAAVCDDIDIQTASRLTIADNNVLQLFGSWNCNGDFYENNSTVEFLGKQMSNLTGVLGQVFYNLRNKNSNGIIFSSGSYGIQGALYAEGGPIITNNSVTLISNTFGTGRIPEIKSLCTYTLVMNDSYGDGWNGGYLNVLENGVSIGLFSAAGTGSTVEFQVTSGSSVVLNYTSGSWENENTYTLLDPSGTLLFLDGINPATGNIYSFIPTCIAFDPFIGDVAIERNLNIINNGWREVSSPMLGLNLNDLQNDGLIMAGFIGSNFPNFPWNSVYTYHENFANGVKEDGWVSALNITELIDYSKAHRIYIGTGNFTTSVSGDINVGDYTYVLDYQNILASELLAPESQKGWNLIGNPYPCTMNWDAIDVSRKQLMEDAIWMWSADAGNYGLYIGTAGIGTNGVDANIASSQGFWVHANDLGASLSFQESDKVDADKVFVKSSLEYTSLKISSNLNSYSDEIVLNFDNNAQVGIDSKDGFKLFSPTVQAPCLSMAIQSARISINSMPYNQELDIPVYAEVGVSGNYLLTCPKHLYSDSLSCIIIEDLQTQVKQIIDTNLVYPFYAVAGDTAQRFIIHYLPKFNVVEIDETCFGSQDGSLNIEMMGASPFVLYYSSVTGVLDSLLSIVPSISIDNLIPGQYILTSNPADVLCNAVVQLVSIKPATEINLTQTILDASCMGCADGFIDLHITGGVAPFEIFVNGDPNIDLTQLNHGTYDVLVIDAAGCEKSSSINVGLDISLGMQSGSKYIAIYPNPAESFINIKCILPASISIYDMYGKLVLQKEISASTSLDVSSLSPGIYSVMLNYVFIEKQITKK
jgi:hypothetical protein